MQVGQRSRSIFFSIILVLSSILVSLVEAPLAHAELVACRGAFATRTVAFSESAWRYKAEAVAGEQLYSGLSPAARLQRAEEFFNEAWAAFQSLAKRPVSNLREIQVLISQAVMGRVAFVMVGNSLSGVPNGTQGPALDHAWMIELARSANPDSLHGARDFLARLANVSSVTDMEIQRARLADVLKLTDRDFLIAGWARFGPTRIPIPSAVGWGAPVHEIDTSLSWRHHRGDPAVVFRLSILASRNLGDSAQRAIDLLRTVERTAGVAQP